MNIIDLQEISPNLWKAKYRGNYGIYTIKIETDGKKTIDFSCSCPSDYYPCKHIPMIEEAIRERIEKNRKNDTGREITLEQLLKDVPQKELYDFIVRHAQYNPQFKNTVLLEFFHQVEKQETSDVNNYNQLLHDALDGIYFDYEDIEYGHYDDILEIGVMNQWLKKAKEYTDQNNPKEALLICKACIEEYASWCAEQEDAIVEYVDIDYKEKPFDILRQIYRAQEIDCKELLNYCKSEMSHRKYKRAGMDDYFSDLFMNLSVAVGSDDFITVQDELWQKVEDKSSYEAKEILQRKIEFYRNTKQPDKADEIIRENLQIESFRKALTQKWIAENKLQEAKKLIDDFISQNKNDYLRSWHELKLQISQKENDIPEIRKLSFLFIESEFNTEYYNIYKKTFTKEEWTEAVEKLIKHYEKRHNANWFNSSVADVLLSEKQAERLMKYIEKHLRIDMLETYYTGFSDDFPEKTLALFRQKIDEYAQNTGRNIYERIVSLLKKMVKIKGGNEVVREMITQYRILYKNRKAMMEIINRF
jgi:hypothetical protein